MKISDSLGLLGILLIGVMAAVVPFLFIYLYWVMFFAMMASTLGANKSMAHGFPGLPSVVGYYFTTFENSIGNINAPTIDFKIGITPTILDNITLFAIYFLWWSAQIILLVVLLNFVIALISQYYEDVMNSKVMHTYLMRHQLNHEHYVFNQFMVTIGLRKDETIDAMIIIDGEEEESEVEWKGLTQTMKKVFVKELDEVKVAMQKDISSLATKQDSFAEDNKLMNARFDEMNARFD